MTDHFPPEQAIAFLRITRSDSSECAAKAQWSDIKRRLKEWGRPELLGLVQDLFEFLGENREFLAAKLLQDRSEASPIEAYRRRIVMAFDDEKNNPDLSQARKAIRDYKKASGDLFGTLELMLVYLETGTSLTLEYGDMYEGFYDSLCSVLDELARGLTGKEGKQFREQFKDRLLALAEKAKGIGWGYGDFVCDAIGWRGWRAGDLNFYSQIAAPNHSHRQQAAGGPELLRGFLQIRCALSPEYAARLIFTANRR